MGLISPPAVPFTEFIAHLIIACGFTFSLSLEKPTDRVSRLLSHEQAAAVLRKLAFENLACQGELISAGAIKHLVKLCSVFDAKGDHDACCKVMWQYSSEAKKLLHDLTYNRKLVGKVREVSEKTGKKIADKLMESGREILILLFLYTKLEIA